MLNSTALAARVVRPEAIDLSGPNNNLDLRIRLGLAQIFGRIPGVSLMHAGLQQGKGGGHELLVAFRGWSPSLFALDHRVAVEVDGRPSDQDFPAAALEAVEGIIDRQTTRQRGASFFGLSAPLDASAKDLELRHLTVDRALPVIAGMANEHFMQEIVEGIRALHRRVADTDADALVDGTSYSLICGLGHFVGTTIGCNVRKGLALVYDGVSLKIIGACVPEMALLALAGRPLRDLVSLHPEIDARIIKSAGSEPAGKSRHIRVELVPDVAPLNLFIK